MSLIRRDASSLDDEREALRRQRAEGAAEIARLKQELTERVQHVRMRELELEEALARAGGRPDPATRFRLPDPRREAQELDARTGELARREEELEARAQALAAEETALAERAAVPKSERELALDEREAELDRRAAELDATTVDERIALLDARLEELKAAELAFVKTQAELAARSDELAQREATVAAKERAAGTNGAPPPAAPDAADVEALEARIRRLEQTGSISGQSFSSGLRQLQRRGNRGDQPL